MACKTTTTTTTTTDNKDRTGQDTMTKYTRTEVNEATEELREILTPGDTIYCVLRHVSPSGMTRWVDLYIMGEDGPRWLSYRASRVVGYPVNTRNHEGIEVGGAGMDMGFHLVYSLASRLYSDGFACLGEGCPSNDHSNREERDWHPEGGYALKHRWL